MSDDNMTYDPPYTLQQIADKYPADVYRELANDPVHSWRANTGIELIHKEPDLAELYGRVKAKLKLLPQTIILDKRIPTTKWCPNCGSKRPMPLDERTYVCECGYSEDRDIHSAKNMLAIKDLVFFKNNFVPTEHREITLMEFKTSTGDASIESKLGRRSEKIAPSGCDRVHLQLLDRYEMQDDAEDNLAQETGVWRQFQEMMK